MNTQQQSTVSDFEIMYENALYVGNLTFPASKNSPEFIIDKGWKQISGERTSETVPDGEFEKYYRFACQCEYVDFYTNWGPQGMNGRHCFNENRDYNANA